MQVETNARLPLDVKFASVATSSSSVTITAESAPLVESETSVRGDLITGQASHRSSDSAKKLYLPGGTFAGRDASEPRSARWRRQLRRGRRRTEQHRSRPASVNQVVRCWSLTARARPTTTSRSMASTTTNRSLARSRSIRNPDAIAEFKIESSVPSAESGRAGGGIISTTFKSGGNDRSRHSRRDLSGPFLSAAASKFDDPTSQPVPNYVTHNYYGTVGGPIFLPRPGEGGKSSTTAAIVRSSSSRSTASETARRSSAALAIRRRCRCRLQECASVISASCCDRELLADYKLAGGGTVIAPIGTIFAPNGTPIPGNDLRNCPSCGRLFTLCA